jgi:hypothetical protein
MPALQFAFIVLVPLVIVAGAVVTLFAVGALFDALEHPDKLREQIEGIFRRPEPPSKTPDAKHYYAAPWKAPQ